METFRPVKVFLEWICSESSSCFISFVPSLSEVLSWDTRGKVGFAQHVIAQLVQCVGLLREVFKIGVGRDAKSFKHLQNGRLPRSLTFCGEAVPPEKRTAHEKLLRKPAQSTAQEVSDSWQSEANFTQGI